VSRGWPTICPAAPAKQPAAKACGDREADGDMGLAAGVLAMEPHNKSYSPTLKELYSRSGLINGK
jgi:hypothetical protein